MQTPDPTAAASTGTGLQSLFDMVMNGGPIMIPIGLCSVISLAYIVERSIRLRRGRLYSKRVARDLVDGVRERGIARGQEVCEAHPMSMTTVIGAGLARRDATIPEMEKATEDAGAREVKRLSAGLRPLVVVGMIAPLLGLLGTVWGMIQAFSNIAMKDGLGKPELLAAGISQALITTAAGLAIAIPTQCFYYYYRSKIDRFVRDTEDLYLQVMRAMSGEPKPTVTPRPVDVESGSESGTEAAVHAHS